MFTWSRVSTVWSVDVLTCSTRNLQKFGDNDRACSTGKRIVLWQRFFLRWKKTTVKTAVKGLRKRSGKIKNLCWQGNLKHLKNWNPRKLKHRKNWNPRNFHALWYNTLPSPCAIYFPARFPSVLLSHYLSAQWRFQLVRKGCERGLRRKVRS